MKPFDRADLASGRDLIALLPRLLAWEGRHLVRWASSVICGHSKVLERRQKTLESLLAEATANAVPTYQSLGILPVPPGLTFHGPLQLRMGAEWCDFRDLHGPATLSGADVERITACECAARRCLTVENATPFRSLAALRSGELLIHTSYPNDATLGMLRQLKTLQSPPAFWHFGDTDPSGFHILADLRERSGIPFRSFHMNFRQSTRATRLKDRERVLIRNSWQRCRVKAPRSKRCSLPETRETSSRKASKPPTHASWPFYDGVE